MLLKKTTQSLPVAGLICGLIFTQSSAWASQSIANHLSGPEVYKLDWNTRALLSHDMDNNGALDLLLLNNERTRIEILYQDRPDLKLQRQKQQKIWQPILEDSRFSRQNIVSGVKMNALAAADLNGDGLTDIAYTSNTFGLSLLYQKAGDKWSEVQHFDYIKASKYVSSLVLKDINSDNKTDIVLIGDKQLLIFYQDEQKQFNIPQRYPFVDSNHFSLTINDVNQDQRQDIIYLAKNSRFALRLRVQNDDGSFGPEQTFPLQTPRQEFTLLNPDKNQYAYIENKTNQLIVGEFSQGTGPFHSPSGDEQESSQKNVINREKRNLTAPQVYPLPFKDIKSENYAIGDINGDQRPDIIAAEFKGAQVWLYRQLTNGKFSKPIAYPSFAGIQSIALADLDQDGIDELYLASKSEQLIGKSHFINDNQLSYPKPLFSNPDIISPQTDENNNPSQPETTKLSLPRGTPIALNHVQLGIEKTPALALLNKHKKERELTIISLNQENKKLVIRQQLSLKKLKLDPNGIKSADINQDGLEDLILFVLHKPAIVLMQNPAGEFKQLSTQNFRQGLLDNLKPGGLTRGDIDNDGKAEILVAGKGYARALRSDKSQQLEIIEQYNAVNRNVPIASVLPINIDQEATKEVLIYQQRSEKIDIFKKDKNQVYRPLNSIQSGQIDMVDSQILQQIDRSDRLLYLGKDRFWILPINEDKIDFNIISRYESSLPEVNYQTVISGDMNQDKIPDILALDPQSTHIVELLVNRSNNWDSLYHFEVYDVQSVSKDTRGSHIEPREVILSDINGDKINDLIFLVHDRILVYFGK